VGDETVIVVDRFVEMGEASSVMEGENALIVVAY